MKKTVKILAVLMGILAVLLVSMYVKMDSDLKALAHYETDLSRTEDGIYRGKAETVFVKAEVEVEVSDHKIVRIELLKHDNGLGKKAEKITEDMVRMNTVEVDAVSGATSSSQVIKSAVSDALANGKKRIP